MPFRRSDGQIIGTVGISHDITERKIFEEQLRTAKADLEGKVEDRTKDLKKLSEDLTIAAIGSIMVHDIVINLLDVEQRLDNVAHALQNGNVQKAEARLTGVKDACKDAILTIEEIRTVAKEGVVRKALVDLNVSVQNWLLPLSNVLSEKEIDYKTSFACDLPKVAINDIMMRTAFRNVCQNAMKELRPSMLFSIRTFFTDGHWVAIEVRDGGLGFSEAILAARRPPFLKRGSTEGFGFGLTIAQRILDLHGGRLEIANHGDGGAMVTLILPINTI
jgi:signal transduction histidine kinase